MAASAQEPHTPISCSALAAGLSWRPCLGSMWALEGAKKEVENIFNETGEEKDGNAARVRAVEAPHIL